MNTVNNDNDHEWKVEADKNSNGDEDDDSKETFPAKLRQVLDDEANNDVIWWGPKRDTIWISISKFKKNCLETFFGGTKYESFTRKLNRWGFRRVKDSQVPPADVAVYRNEFFKEDEPELMKKMKICTREDLLLKNARTASYYRKMLIEQEAAKRLVNFPASTVPLDALDNLRRKDAISAGSFLSSQLHVIDPIVRNAMIGRGSLRMIQQQQTLEENIRNAEMRLLQLEESRMSVESRQMLLQQHSLLPGVPLQPTLILGQSSVGITDISHPSLLQLGRSPMIGDLYSGLGPRLSQVAYPLDAYVNPQGIPSILRGVPPYSWGGI